MKKLDPLVLGSTNTMLAYRVNQRFYGNIHYVWCAPFENLEDLKNPISSNPKTIYKRLKEDIDSGDSHSPLIRQNKEGIRKGAIAQFKNGTINDDQCNEIIDSLEFAELRDFKPLIYLIPWEKVKDIIKKVSLPKKANIMSKEYIIEKLPREYFEIFFEY